MSNQHLEKKVRQDAMKLKKDLNTLVGDSAVMYRRFENTVSRNTDKVKDDLATWVEDGVSQFGEEFEKITGEARETVDRTTTTVMKNVSRGLSQYNSKVQEIVNQVPGDIGKKVAKYPWVALTITLSIGLLLGFLLKPARVQFGSQTKF